MSRGPAPPAASCLEVRSWPCWTQGRRPPCVRPQFTLQYGLQLPVRVDLWGLWPSMQHASRHPQTRPLHRTACIRQVCGCCILSESGASTADAARNGLPGGTVGVRRELRVVSLGSPHSLRGSLGTDPQGC